MQLRQTHKLAVAPMMEWTDRHCRVFHRRLTRHALLYTEMIVADAVIHGDRARLLGYSPEEHPLAMQLGGSDPAKLAEAATIAADLGYDEINLNVGCPSDRVKSGTFGACLMRAPALVGDCIAAMKARAAVPVTVKCRLGVDEQDTEVALDAVADVVLDAGGDAIWVHARKAWLDGLSPKENRSVPPLDYTRVYRLKQRLAEVFVGINGGINSLDAAAVHLAHVDGAMLGRAAYQSPAILADVDERLFGGHGAPVDLAEVALGMVSYAEAVVANGGRLHHITRHMLGLFNGRPGARRWRQILARAGDSAVGPALIREALAAVQPAGRIEPESLAA
jgi:tRNA-dihydrouridine synthase A